MKSVTKVCIVHRFHIIFLAAETHLVFQLIFNTAPDSLIYNNKVYEKCVKKFQQREKNRRRPLRVLDLFSDIGSGTIVL